MIEIVYEVDCHCGGTATSTTLAVDQPEDDGRVHIDVEMSVGQRQFECVDCRCRYVTDDIGYGYGDGYDDDCAGPDGDDDEDNEDRSIEDVPVAGHRL